MDRLLKLLTLSLICNFAMGQHQIQIDSVIGPNRDAIYITYAQDDGVYVNSAGDRGGLCRLCRGQWCSGKPATWKMVPAERFPRTRSLLDTVLSDVPVRTIQTQESKESTPSWAWIIVRPKMPPLNVFQIQLLQLQQQIDELKNLVQGYK